MKVLFFLTVWLCSTPLWAWGPRTHALMVSESLQSVAQTWGLEETVRITPFSQFLTKLTKVRPEIQTREDFARWLEIHPDSRFDRPSKSETIGAVTTPLEILERYAPRADDGRDLNLPYDRAEQFWFGSGVRSATQAFRHMEKPPFHPLHPLNTFGFPLGTIGQATDRAQIYFDLALLAHRMGEPYWAWNFLGVGLHYIEDLAQPYHAAQLIPPLAWEGVRAYWQWGRKDGRGFIKTVTHVVSNAHHYFEGYIDQLFREEGSAGRLWRKALQGEDVWKKQKSIKELARKVRNDSNRMALQTIETTFRLTGSSLLGPRAYYIGEDGNPQAEDPRPYLNTDRQAREEGSYQASQIVIQTFKMGGTAIRTMVKEFLKRREDHV